MRSYRYLRIWPLVAGVLLSVWYFGAILAGTVAPELVSVLIAAIGGYELFFVSQDNVNRRRRGHG